MHLDEVGVDVVAVPFEWVVEVPEGIAHDESVVWEFEIVELVEEEPFISRWSLDKVELELKCCPMHHLVEFSLFRFLNARVFQTYLQSELKILFIKSSARLRPIIGSDLYPQVAEVRPNTRRLSEFHLDAFLELLHLFKQIFRLAAVLTLLH